jgi:two-component system chemotaxis response regulator CheB
VKLNRLIVIGASAGGVPALIKLAAGLPTDLPAAVLAVLHVGNRPSVLPRLLAEKSHLAIAHARQGETIQPACVRIAPPDHHLVVVDGQMQLSRGPKENYSRPAIDPLFRSAALAYGPSTIGVVLTGGLDDGTAGLQAIKQCGGIAVVQDPRDAFAPSMPESALKHVSVDHCLPLGSIPALLAKLSSERVDLPATAADEGLLHAQALFLGQGSAMDHLSAIGKPSPFACPECHGGLWEVSDTSPTQYRCHTGHGFTARSLDHALETAADEANWNALRALQERQIFLAEMALRDSGGRGTATAFDAVVQELRRKGDALREMLERPADEPGDIPQKT